MTNFESMPYGKELLEAMYNVPRSEFSTKQIVELLRNKLECPTISEVHVSKLYKDELGLELRKRLKVPAKPVAEKRVNVMELLREKLQERSQEADAKTWVSNFLENNPSIGTSPTLFPTSGPDDDGFEDDEEEELHEEELVDSFVG